MRRGTLALAVAALWAALPAPPRLTSRSVKRRISTGASREMRAGLPAMRSMRPSATRRVILIDFRRIPGHSTEWVLSHVRSGQETFEAEIAAATSFEGFREGAIRALGFAFAPDRRDVRLSRMALLAKALHMLVQNI